MKTIHKYELKPSISLPIHPGAEVLSILVKDGAPHMWVLVDTDLLEKHKNYRRVFSIFPTGGEIPRHLTRANFAGTFQLNGLVFHVFEEH